MTIMAVITVQHEISTPKNKTEPTPTPNVSYKIHIYRTGKCVLYISRIKYYSDDGKLRVINLTENKK